MKAKVIFIIFILVYIAINITSCKKNSDDNNDIQLTEEQSQEIKSSYSQINNTASQILLDDNPLSELNQHIQEFRNEPGIENVWISGDALFVKFINGNVVSWIVVRDYLIPPYGDNLREVKNRIPVGNNNACLINQQFGDESRPYCKKIINELQQEFTDDGYNVTVKNGGQADLDFFKQSLNNYGAIFYISHGAYDGTHTWIVTGEEANEPEGTLDKLLHDLFLSWKEGKISIGHCKEKRNGNWIIVPFYMFSEKYVESTYNSGDFPNSLIYLVACQSFKTTNQLATAYNNKGAGVTIGWDETNCLGQATGKLLFDLLLGGATVEEAFNALPEESKVDNCAVSSGANLVYYPPSGKDMSLVNEKDANLFITSLENGNSYTYRVQTLAGYAEGIEQIDNGTVEVNGITTSLELSSATEFNQPILINNGNNTVKVNCIGKNSTGSTVYATKEIIIIGDIETLDLFTELRWNTNYSDVDFHLLPPDAGMDALWTDEDCFYNNKTTDWGGFLDVDDVDGFGPEHITIPSVTLNGTYRLFIHYYDKHGADPTQAYVNLSVKNDAIQSFGPYLLTNDGGYNAGDVWEVCTIDFPDGTITPVNKLYNLGRAKRNLYLPQKH